MSKDPSPTSDSVKIGEASKILGLHTDTLRRWEKSGKITTVRTPGGTRLYSLEALRSLIPEALNHSSKPQPKKVLPTKNSNKRQRITVEGSYTHVYNRGVDEKIIFNDEEDYQVFLGFLEDYLTPPKSLDTTKKTFQVHGRIFRGTPHLPKNYFNSIKLIAYNLMPNHFHLLLYQVTKDSLENFIRSLCTRYSMYFNKKYQRGGSLFEGPYKSIPVKDGLQLINLTRFFHQSGGYSSYQEYLGTRETPWVKPKVVLSQFNKEITYKDFVEKQRPDQTEIELIEDITFDNQTDHLERSHKWKNLARGEKLPKNIGLETRSYMTNFLVVSSAVFLLLATVGIGNIKLSEAKAAQHLPTPAVLGKVASPIPQNSPEIKANTTIKVKADSSSQVINIHQKPTINSPIISHTKNGDTFDLISKQLDWFEVKLASGSAGFISAEYVEEGVNK